MQLILEVTNTDTVFLNPQIGTASKVSKYKRKVNFNINCQVSVLAVIRTVCFAYFSDFNPDRNNSQKKANSPWSLTEIHLSYIQSLKMEINHRRLSNRWGILDSGTPGCVFLAMMLSSITPSLGKQNLSWIAQPTGIVVLHIACMHVLLSVCVRGLTGC